jgi:signal transduction histidine kinase
VKLLPRTLAGRVLLIILAGLVVAHVAGYALFEAERARALDRFAATEIAARIAEYARAGPQAPQAGPSQAGPPQPGAPRMRPRLRWQEVESLGEPPAGASEPSSHFVGELRRLLAENLGEDPVAWVTTREMVRPEMPPGEVRRTPGGPGGFGGPGGREFNRAMMLVTVALKLPGGRLARAEAPFYQPSLQVPSEAWISLALLFFVTALFSIWAVRLAVQPVRMLAEAADRLSRNIDEAPLPESGAREIHAAARAFNRMQDRLKRHVNTRALAFAAMSHDMRTPLTRMRLRLESLGDSAKDKLGDDLDEIEALAQSALEVTRGLAPDEGLGAVEVNALAQRLVFDYAELGKPIVITGSAAPVNGRPAAIRRALGNLIDNAFKYGRDVTLDIVDSRDHVDVRVCDRGPGIPAADLPKVTTPFFRVESSRNRGTGGAGLGLAIARDIVEGHGGELLLANREGGGLCATVRIPR